MLHGQVSGLPKTGSSKEDLFSLSKGIRKQAKTKTTNQKKNKEKVFRTPKLSQKIEERDGNRGHPDSKIIFT